MDRVYEDKAHCSGCTACKSICGKNAIYMEEDDQGFLYPVIDQSLCVACGRCTAVCPLAKTDPGFQKEAQQIYAVQHQAPQIVRQSSSGGAFTLISDVILQHNGVIFGCVIDRDFQVIHTMAADSVSRDRMRGSKYVQSDLREVYRQVKQVCEQRPVLFVGTPCQVAGLNAYLGKIPEDLVTVDFICHGTPPAKLLRDHIRFLETKYRKKAASYKFRDKKYGWRHVETVLFEDGTEKTNYWTFRLKHLFRMNISLRPACYNCAFTVSERVADITIGDFWGAEKTLGIYDNTGISVVMVNSSKGVQLINSLEKSCILREVELADIMQRALSQPIRKPSGTEKFWQTYYKGGYESIVETYRESRVKHELRFVPVAIITGLGMDKYFNMLKTKWRKRK